MRWPVMLAGFWAVAATPLAALADEKQPYDGRLEGYGRSVTLDSSSGSLLWLLLIGLAIVILSVLFKNARRTHLD
ncbi:MAG: hypothetical protein ABR964_15775 [Tepidisphaeraceae bacterium]